MATTILLYEGIVKRICEISFFSSDSDNKVNSIAACLVINIPSSILGRNMMWTMLESAKN